MKNKSIFTALLIGLFVGILAAKAQEKSPHKNSPIETLLKKKKAYNKKYGYGFRIQIFNGEETIARKIKNKFITRRDSIPVYLKYESPEWKVQAGNCRTHLEADIILNKLKKEFKGAIVVPL